MRTIGDVAKRDAKYALLGAAVGIWLAVTLSPLWGGVLIALFLMESFLLWRQTKAGVYLSFFTCLLAAALIGWLIYSKGFSIGRAVLLGFMFFSIWGNWLNFGDILRNRATWDDPDDNDERPFAKDQFKDRTTPSNGGGEAGDEKPMTSIVLLRSKPKALDDRILLEHLRDAWDEHRKLGEDELFVAGDGPIHIVKSPQGMWMIHNHASPYFDGGNPAERMPELRLRKALEEHAAWISVDLMHGFVGDLPPDIYYPYIFRLIRELADEDTLAILRPETGEINIWNDEVATRLGSMEPLEAFATPVHSPVISVSDQDPRMKDAVDEARGTFATFRENWAGRGSEDFFLAKVPLRDGENSEIIWIEVIGLEPEFIHGTLANEPVNVEGYHSGDRIEAPIKDIYDWAIAKQGADAPLGLFTEKVVRAVRLEALQAMERSHSDSDKDSLGS
jgi:uncharacterized protein YegJ (DUF2314 family)